MRDKSRDPSESESGISPLFESDDSGNKKRHRTQKFGDTENYPQLLWLPHMGKPLNGLRTT
jgi:hypothetical protein